MNNRITMYFLVRSDLKMSKGKIASQVGHAVEGLISHTDKKTLKKYQKHHSPKICLKVQNLDELHYIQDLLYQRKVKTHTVIDMGLTEVKSNTTTVLGVGPIHKNVVRDLLSKYCLL